MKNVCKLFKFQAAGILGYFAAAILCAIFINLSRGAQAAPSSPDEAAKLKFLSGKIRLGAKTLSVELADNHERQEQGLMFREKLSADGGMLFIFSAEEPLAFWMKNTVIPLSIGYFDHDKKLVRIIEMEPAIAGEKNPKSYPSGAPAMYALEMSKGWFARNKIAIGAKFSFLGEQKP
jgi:uncharacterized membrane protein (UPF0127 family)